MWEQIPNFTVEVDKFVENVKIFVQLLREFLDRKNTAILMIESSFFKRRELEDLLDGNLGQILTKYKRVIIVIPETTLSSLDAEHKRDRNIKSRKILRKIVELFYEAKIKKTLLGNHLQISQNANITFLFPNDYFMQYREYKVDDTTLNKPEIKFFSIALKFEKFFNVYITGFNPVLWRFCRESASIQHLNPIKLNKERIKNEYLGY